MVADQQNPTFHRIRSALSYVVLPVQYVVNFPVSMVGELMSDVATQQTLLAENANLHAQILLLNAQLQKQYVIESENRQLKELLSSSDKANGQVLEAQLLAVSPDPYMHQVVVNKGSKDGIFEGQPVLDAQGVMGQVVQVSGLTSRVMLLTDSKSAVPVEDKRNGIRAVVTGTGDVNSLKLAYVTNTTDIQVGDMLITSGLGQHYPMGYPVGKVTSVDHPGTNRFADITVEPSAELHRSRLVLLVWPLKTEIAPEIKEALAKQQG